MHSVHCGAFPTLYCYNCKLLRGSNLVLGISPVQCLAAPCLNQGPNLPFQWFFLFFMEGWLWFADRLGVADSMASSAFTSLRIDLHLHSPCHPSSRHLQSLNIKTFFSQDLYQELFLFSLREKMSKRGYFITLWGLVCPEFEVRSKFTFTYLSSTLSLCPSFWKFYPNLHFKMFLEYLIPFS